MAELRREYFGIDFGTTNSAVIGRYRNKGIPYGDENGQPFPSLVAVSEATGEAIAIGREVWNRREELSESCRILSSSKIQLGTGLEERIGPELWTPERVTSEIFKVLKKRVFDRGNGAILDDLVIAIPVGFDPKRRKSLRNAAKVAGITIKGFITEPTAAVISNFEKVRHWPYVAVFDWGGGTLDIAVVRITEETVQEIATKSLFLGGDDLDLILAEWAHMQVLKGKHKEGPPFSGMSAKDRDLIKSQCEKAKRGFSDDDIMPISLNRYGELGIVDLPIIYEEFESLMSPKIEEAILALEECVLHDAGLSFDQIGCILMVGGCSNLRGLREAMDARQWSCARELPKDSDWNVANGASLLASNFGDYVCAQNVGIRLCDNTIYPLINMGDLVDNEPKTISFGLIEDTDNARFVLVEYKSNTKNGLLSSDKILGYLAVPAFGFSNEPIKLEMYIDKDLLLNLTAQSECKGESKRKIWTYPQLRFSYRIPGAK